jgi:hypothetical protein
MSNILSIWFNGVAMILMGVAAVPFVFLVVLFSPFMDMPGLKISFDTKATKKEQEEVEEEEENEEE